MFVPQRKRLSRVKKTTAVLKRAMTKKSERWQSRNWYGNTKTRWQQTTGCDGGQSSHDVKDHARSKGKWKEISAEFYAVGTTVKEKKNTWHTSGKESSKREPELHTVVESAATDEKREERDRCRIRDQLVEVRKRREEEDEARCLTEEMQRNLDAAQNKKVMRQNKGSA